MNHLVSPDRTAVLFSGGLDSSILVGHLLAAGHRVRPIYVNSGLIWQDAELAIARRFLKAIVRPGLEELVVLELPLDDVYEDHWSMTGRGVPGEDSADEAVYLPGRNPLLVIKARLWCQIHGVEQLALGVLAANPFADATDEFFADFESVLDRSAGGHVHLVRPFAKLDKRRVMALGRELPLEWTFSCLAPRDGAHCARCNKCAERKRAFQTSGLVDPTVYIARRQEPRLKEQGDVSRHA